MRHIGAMLAVVAGLAAVGPAAASGDDSCYPQWQLTSPAFSCAGRIALTPGNDSRLNLFLLLRSRSAAPDAVYPPHGYEEREFAHTFVSWSSVRDIWFPKLKSTDSVDASYAMRDGSRCDSFKGGTQAFADALTAEHGLPRADRDALTKARAAMSPQCDAASPPAAPTWPSVASRAGRDFLGYLKAADAFYRGDWATARSGFAALAHSRQRWVAETAAYMIARVELGAAIAADFDKYGDFTGAAQADHAAASRAGAAITAYLHGWPHGQYAESAKGLTRRALWLAGDQAGLGRAYEAMLAQTPVTAPAIVDLINEIDDKLLTTAGAEQQVDTPLLLATLDLMRMRSSVADDGTRSAPLLAAGAFADQKPHFAGRPELYAFLQATRAYYLDHDAEAASALAPAAAPVTAYRPLEFSARVLHGMALADLRDSGEAAYWRGLLGGATGLYQRPLVELALARNFERNGRLAAAFAPASPLTEAQPRTLLLQHDAGPALLRALAQGGGRNGSERALAGFALLWKELSRGHYADFLGDFRLVRTLGLLASSSASQDMANEQPDASGNDNIALFAADIPDEGYPCPTLTETVAKLARVPADPQAMLCLGDFYRLKLNDVPALDVPAPAGELGSGPSDFAGAPTPRGQLYQRVIADPQAPATAKAYALYRAVNCYAPSGNNDCGGKDVPNTQRRAWFEQLKHEYAGSSWAKALRYYW